MSVVREAEVNTLTSMPGLPENRDAASTARWIQSCLSGERPVPGPIVEQVRIILDVLSAMA